MLGKGRPVTPDEFGRRLHTIHRRIDGLARDGAVPPDETMEELRTALEELRMADQELRQQNEELAAAQLQLEIERQRYLDLFELAPDAYISTDVLGVITEANQSASRLLRIPHRTLPGRPLAPYVSIDDRPRFRALLSQRDPGLGSTTLRFKVQPRHGEPLEAEFTYSTAHDFRGNAVGFRWIIRDITEQQRLAGHVRALTVELEQKVLDRTADLRAAQSLSDDLLVREQAARHAAEASAAESRHVQKLESIGILAGGIAHDFNNLLHVVLGNADLALGQLPKGTPARESLEEVVRATLRAADLTRQLLAYSGKGAFVVRHLDLSSEVREMATLLRTAISKQAVLAWELAPDLPAVSADPTQIRQIVMNLITNASDALGEESGTLTLRTGVVHSEELQDDRYGQPRQGEGGQPAPGPYVYLEVADTGAGMSQDTLNRIFDPFFSTKFTGRGLGLAAVTGIVRAHNGLIRIRTDPGQGTSFRVLFPPVAGPARKEEEPPSMRSGWRGTGTILVVDDEEGVRDVAERMLQEIGFCTITAEDGRQALDLLTRAEDRITGILLDLSMPRMGGQETLARLRATRPDLPVVMMSGYTQQVVAEQLGESTGSTAFLQKPFVAEDLVTAFRRFVEAPG
jgi:PAS domain S-box-containing protein